MKGREARSETRLSTPWFWYEQVELLLKIIRDAWLPRDIRKGI